MIARICLAAVIVFVSVTARDVRSQDKSVNPGINDSFRDPDVEEFVGRFEVESRELYTRRQEIVAECRIQPGETVADVGAGTGLFTRLFSEAVGKEGRVIAVDISQKFLDHITATSRQAGQRNVDTLLATADSTGLPPASVDVAFICDTYHHFEFPLKTMASIERALKPGGRVILVDFRRIPGESTEWVLEHVRAGQGAFEREIREAGFVKVREESELLGENYFVEFRKQGEEAASADGLPWGRGRVRGRGMGAGRGRGPGPKMRADQEVFHYLLAHHEEVRRSVTKTGEGVETLTESDNPDVTRKIQEHVASMHERIQDGRGLRYWDELFAEIFRRHKLIEMSVDNTEKGVRVRESSDDPVVVALIQAHAEAVSMFVEYGFEEAHRNHPVSGAVVDPSN